MPREASLTVDRPSMEHADWLAAMPAEAWGQAPDRMDHSPSQEWHVAAVPPDWHAGLQASSIGAGHLILVARELTGLSQAKLARRMGLRNPRSPSSSRG